MQARRRFDDHPKVSLVGLLERYPVGRTLVVSPGGRLAQAGDRAHQLWVISEGTVRWIGTDLKGRQRVVITQDAPTAVGLAEILIGAPYSCDVEAECPARGFTVRAEVLQAAIANEPRVAQGLLKWLAALNLALALAEAEQHLDIETRLAAHLLEVSRRYGQPGPRGMLLRQPLTEQSLSDRLGTVPRSIRRVLAKWRQQGWVERHKGWLILARPQDLATLHPPSAD